ncbi:MAG: glycosyltransferase family 4 protein [Leptolyngbya sp. Prado105]|jgi:glycosyltransferase involved in cell wall biosynthesis|nr:glycosyltransferase family 4 protein [Leptolyngbya sp. Prado105]
MKPRIIHLLDDQNVGNVTQWIEAISEALNDQFEFQLVRSSEIAILRRSDLVIYHNRCSWKRSRTLLALKRQKLKVILHEHHYSEGYERSQVRSKIRCRSMLKLNYQCVDRVVAVSRGQSDWMRSHQLAPFTKLELIPFRVKLDHLMEVSEKQIQQPFVVGAYGRFVHSEGFDILIKAMRLVPDVFLYLGGHGEDAAALEALAADCSNLKFWGRVKDVPGFLSACDAIVIPSRWNPGAVGCGEAKAAGKPVIAFDIDGLSEQVEDCGILVPPYDVAQLAHAIATMATSSQLETWSQNARASMQGDWELHVEQWNDLLWNLAKLEQ